MTRLQLCTTTLAALAFIATATRAQDLDRILNKAKTKVGQTTSASPASTGGVVAQAAQGNTGDIPSSPSMNELNVTNNQEFARALLTNHRPWVKGQGVNDDDYWYRWLRDEDKMPVKFTWDEPFVEYITPKQRYLWFVINDICDNLHQHADPGNPELSRYFRGPMSKVEEIHFTTTPKRLVEGQPGATEGYTFSFSPATGVLTMACSTVGGNAPGNFERSETGLRSFIQQNAK